MSLVDPSGYSWFSKNWKSLTASIVGIAVAAFVPGGQTFGIIVLKGALGGAASGLAGALLNGANIGQITKSTIVGGFWGGVSAGAANGVGSFAKTAANPLLAKLVGHSLSQGSITALQGGNFKHGFISGLVSAGGGYGMMKSGVQSKFVLVSANAVIGGTASELGGGKFANGAITGSFLMLFNEVAHQRSEQKRTAFVKNLVSRVIQRGDYNCLAASAEMVEMYYGGSRDQDKFRSIAGGNAEVNPIPLEELGNMFTSENGYTTSFGIAPGVIYNAINRGGMVIVGYDNGTGDHASVVEKISVMMNNGSVQYDIQIVDPDLGTSGHRPMTNSEINSIKAFGIINKNP